MIDTRTVPLAVSAVFVDEVGRRRRCMVIVGRTAMVVSLAATLVVVTALTFGARTPLGGLPDAIAAPAERVINKLADLPGSALGRPANRSAAPGGHLAAPPTPPGTAAAGPPPAPGSPAKAEPGSPAKAEPGSPPKATPQGPAKPAQGRPAAAGAPGNPPAGSRPAPAAAGRPAGKGKPPQAVSKSPRTASPHGAANKPVAGGKPAAARDR